LPLLSDPARRFQGWGLSDRLRPRHALFSSYHLGII
jgi:hypothetical protein